LLVTGVAVEELARHEFAEIASRQKALQTIFPSLLDILYHPIFDFFQKNRLFQQPHYLSTRIQDHRKPRCQQRLHVQLEAGIPGGGTVRHTIIFLA
jgi:hypothetical protein